MTLEQQLADFANYVKTYLKGDEKGEAQIYLDRLFTALGFVDGLRGAEARSEQRIRFTLDEKSPTKFADLVIPGRVLIEMKKRGEDLSRHQLQALDYWKYLTPHPRYIILCNFDELWVYDMERQVDYPLAKLMLDALPNAYGPLLFLLPEPAAPVFTREFDLVELTKDAATKLGAVFNSMTRRIQDPVPADQAQRFILQCMLALFAEDIGLLPRYTFTKAIDDCIAGHENTHDLFSLLFFMMNVPGKKRAGRFHTVDYFNGGLFHEIHPVLLSQEELRLLRETADHNWGKIRPAIFGTIFESSMNADERHAAGAHFTSEADILRIVEPVIVRPWSERINAAKTPDALRAAHAALCDYSVLDPACGSGNFLYVAYREMKRLERQIMLRLAEMGAELYPPEAEVETPPAPPILPSPTRRRGKRKSSPPPIPAVPAPLIRRTVSVQQFYGFDIKPFAVELARVTLMIAKKLVAVDELGLDESALPLDNLDANIRAADALLTDWPEFDACIGNPPYLGAKRLKVEYGVAYVNQIRAHFPDVPGNADYCVYWFRKAHEVMKPGTRAGLVGTNTIRQNYSRIGGLDYIAANDGHIYEAFSSFPWSGEANVHVSIAVWSKGQPPQRPRLWVDDGARVVEPNAINTSLSERIDVSSALRLLCNIEPKRVFQGLIPGHEAYVLKPSEAVELVRKDANSTKVLFPYLIGRDLTASPGAKPSRFVIDLNSYDLIEAQRFRTIFSHIKSQVLPVRQQKANEEIEENNGVLQQNPNAKLNHTYEQALSIWWKHTAKREDMMNTLPFYSRYIVCSRVTKRPIFEFAKLPVRPSDLVQVFAFDDDYSFGILQSNLHWLWFIEKASTLKSDYRYTPHSVFDTFPWPQNPASALVQAVADAGRTLHEFRRRRMAADGRLTLRELYRSLELPGKNPLKDLHTALDAAVLAAYGFGGGGDDDLLRQLLELNTHIALRIEAGESVTAPGIPTDFPDPAALVSEGCIQPPELI